MTVERNRVGIIGDEDTIIGFQICGLVDNVVQRNFIPVTNETPEEDLIRYFKELSVREDISIVFVCDFVAAKIRNVMDECRQMMPSILEIPSKIGFNM
ncbi:H(+)-transporting V1 sector ATPase subunit F [Conglomerata obtusa]